MATIEQALSLVDLLENELLRRRPDIQRTSGYYRGEQRLAFASEQFRKFHGERYRNFADNWVQVVSDSPVERLTVTGMMPSGATEADKESWRVWQENALDADSQLGFLGAVNSGRSFVLVWGNPDDESTPQVTFEDASQCIVVYEPGSRRRRRAALKRWDDGARSFATLYLPDEVWKFERALLGPGEKSVQMQQVDEEMATWVRREIDGEPYPLPNPMGVVPMVELPNRPTLAEDPISDVTGVIAMQDAVNLTWAMLFTAMDYASFPQRIVTGAEVPEVPILGENGQIVGSKPVDLEKFAVDRVMFFTGDNVKTDEWTAANLEAYTKVIEVAVGHIAAQTRTPQHYLVGKMANLSGDALLAAETGLVKRVEEKQIWFGQALREMFRLIALAQGDDAKARSMASGRVVWAEAESRSHAQMADALLKLKQIGFPFEFLALRYGLTPTEVIDLLAMRDRELAADPLGAMTALMARNPQEGAADGMEPAST
ncbi:phage portal protein [Streptomyces europaeiscabiei]|uniref:Phage portal protein n=1 Tax=Streptomyces europaeiscabiei TaxID=146819 RepID=A0ABU4N7C8_9ACTN|nr:phage portal protein [Streptomyces europaeiscabiei]MDX3550974.1 phage portal protein [Streptomyces europaeiscabiei]MDX3698466.1 phage portal protein [Streptomyces europaeiscabiei]